MNPLEEGIKAMVEARNAHLLRSVGCFPFNLPLKGIFTEVSPSESVQDGVYTAKMNLPGVEKKDVAVAYCDYEQKFTVKWGDLGQSTWEVDQPISPKSLKAKLDLGVLTITAKVKDTTTKVEVE